MTSISQRLFPRKAILPLHFVIVGAGITGLACAINLKHAGHNVNVLEREKSIGKGVGGIRCPPNMTKLLLRMGLKDMLKESAIECPRLIFRDGRTGEAVYPIRFHKEIMKELEADVFLMHHADLHKSLYNLALNSGVDIIFGEEVIDVDPQESTVILSNGNSAYADIIIGADGGRSKIRSAIVVKPEVPERTGPQAVNSFTIPVNSIEDDPDFSGIIKDRSWNVWMGDNTSVVTHLVRSGREVAVNIYYWEPDSTRQPIWTNQVSSSSSSIDVSAFDQRIRRLTSMATSIVQTPHIILPSLDSWIHPTGNVLVVGEAAHLLNPESNHGTALGIEDAAVLGTLFSQLRHRKQIKYLLTAFQELRQERCRMVEISELGKVMFPALPKGPQQEARDAGFCNAVLRGAINLDNAREDYLREQWEEFKDIFGYNAYEAAENWWVQWGRILERAVDLDSNEKLDLIFNSEVTVENC